jgi:hypothetical protein
LDAEEQDY